MSDLEKRVDRLLDILVKHVERAHPDADMTQECGMKEDTHNEIKQAFVDDGWMKTTSTVDRQYDKYGRLLINGQEWYDRFWHEFVVGGGNGQRLRFRGER